MADPASLTGMMGLVKSIAGSAAGQAAVGSAAGAVTSQLLAPKPKKDKLTPLADPNDAKTKAERQRKLARQASGGRANALFSRDNLG